MNNVQLQKIFASTKLAVSEKTYTVVSLPVKYWDFILKHISPDEYVALTRENDEELCLVIDNEKWNQWNKAELEYVCSENWRLFSFTSEGLLQLVGYLARISVLLAQNDISIMASSTYNKSHLLVQDKDFNKTKAILKIFLSQPNI